MNSIRQCTAKASCKELCSVDWKHFRKSFLPKIKLGLVNQEADYKLCGIFPHASKSAFFEIKHKNLDALDVLLGSGWDQLLLGPFVTRVTVKVSQRHWEIAILFYSFLNKVSMQIAYFQTAHFTHSLPTCWGALPMASLDVDSFGEMYVVRLDGEVRSWMINWYPELLHNSVEPGQMLPGKPACRLATSRAVLVPSFDIEVE